MFVFTNECPRKRTDCKTISNIVTDGSFFCCGENDGTIRPVAQDKYSFCVKGPHRDDMVFNDKRDMIDNMTVLSAALSWIEIEDCKAYHVDLPEDGDV